MKSRIERVAGTALSAATALSAGPVAAALPLNIEELLVAESVLKLSTASRLSHYREPLLAPGPSGVPALGWRDVELLDLSTGLRYGVTPRLEVNLRYALRRQQWRAAGAAVASDGDALQFGVNWLALPGGAAPALLVDASAELAARAPGQQGGRSWLGGGSLALTAYHAIDPVVLSAALRYEHGRPRRFGTAVVAPGDRLRLTPQINFAVNGRVTLIGGFELALLQPDRIDGRSVGSRRTGTGVQLGLGYALGSASTVFVQTEFATGGAAGAGASIEWLYEF
jgi:hypothetical protein